GLKASAGIDQLDIDAHLIARFADTAFEKVADSELATDVGRGLVGNFKRRHGRARSYVHTLDFGKFCRDFIGHAVAEVGAALFGAEILEGKHSDGWPSGESSRTYGGILAIPEHAGDGYKR